MRKTSRAFEMLLDVKTLKIPEVSTITATALTVTLERHASESDPPPNATPRASFPYALGEVPCI